MKRINTKMLSFGKKYGLLISDTEVEFVSWKRGEFERIGIFSNDDDGLAKFSAELQKNANVYKSGGFRILANIIGEDYRIERTAHLIGKYKSDLHKRRIKQLFRGISLGAAQVQGRDEHGRREDIVMFYGMINEAKVLPWMEIIVRDQEVYLEAVVPVSFANVGLMKAATSEWRKKPRLLMTMHEKGLLRQTHYDRGNVQFSRVSKMTDDNVEGVVSTIKKELERTIQYLNSLKISMANGLDIDFICPANMVGQLRELIRGSEKIRFNFHDASEIGRQVGLKSALGELGLDSSLSMQLLFTHTWLQQLASINQIRYYWMKTVASIAMAAFIAFGSVGFLQVGQIAFDGLGIGAENSDLTAQRAQLQAQYDNEFGQLEEPPSTPENITAVSEAFRVFSNIQLTPGQLIYYFGKAFEQNRLLQLSSMRWFVTSNPANNEGQDDSIVTGQDIYQVLEVGGEFLPVPGESYLDVADRADDLIASFEQRSDIEVQVVQVPGRELDAATLQGTLTENFDIDAARERAFFLRIVWKQYDADRISRLKEKQI